MPLNLHFRRLLPLAALLLFAAMAASRLAAMSLEGRQDRRQFEDSVRDAFLKEDYELLEVTVAELRAKKDRFPEGVWTLSVFYSALDLNDMPLFAIRELEARLGRWQKAHPGSSAVHIVRSQSLRDSHWVQVEGGAKISGEERLARARAELEAVANVPGQPPGPDWLAESLRVAWRSQVPRAEFEALYERAVAAEPGYHLFYFAKADYLRMWGGAGTWEAFALEAGQKNLSGEGMGLYSRIVWSQSQLYSDGFIFRRSAVEWPRMRDGFRDLERVWPGSDWNLNNFCRFACLAGDRGTARELFARIGERWTTNWLSHAAFEGWRTWATADVDPQPALAVRLAGPQPGVRPEGHAVTFAPDGKTIFGGCQSGHVFAWDAATGAIRWRGELGAGEVHALAVSPDGRTLAAGTARTRSPGFIGTIGVWDLPVTGDPASPAPTRRLGTQNRGGPQAMRWAADGRTLAAVGGSFKDHFGEVWLWAMPEGRELRHLTDGPMVLQAVAFLSPDGRRLAQASGQSFHVVEAATGEKVPLPTGDRMHACSVRALALSPDGRTLACATADQFMDRDRPAEVAFWDTATWTRRPAPGITHAGGVLALAWSPDGRWLLGGGYDGFLRVWDAATGKTVHSWPPEPGDGQISGVAWSPDGRRAAAVRLPGAGSVQAFNPPPAGR